MDAPDTAISITLLSEEESVDNIKQMFYLLDMRPTITRIERIATIVTSLFVHHNGILSEQQLAHLAQIVAECEEILILRFSNDNIHVVASTIFLFHALFAESQKKKLEARDAELRSQYRASGLHGMHQIQRATGAASPHSDEACCVVCMDAAPDQNTSALCNHEPVVCAACAPRLDVCPTCRSARIP